MKFIGLTGGVGAGKTTVLKAMKQMYRVRILIADEIAHEQMEPGTMCYKRLHEAFGSCAVCGNRIRGVGRDAERPSRRVDDGDGCGRCFRDG